MSATATHTIICVGCGAEVEVSIHGRRRKWCTEHCRKQTLYASPCIDCGAPTWHGCAGRANQGRCVQCANKEQVRQKWLEIGELDAEIIRRRKLGYYNWAIEEDLGLPFNTVASHMSRLKSLGFDVPKSPYYVEHRT